MRFKTIDWQEKHYKRIAFFAVLIITAAALVYYFCLSDKTDVFIPSTLYALFLYIIGAYKSNISARTDSLFLYRVDIYNNLKKAKEVLDQICKNENFEDTRFHISAFRVFTGREEDPNAPKIYYFEEKGLKFNHKELKIEDLYLELFEKFSSSISDLHNATLGYIRDNSIELSTPFCNTDYNMYYNPDFWCKKTLKNYSSDRKKVTDFIYSEIEARKLDFSELEAVNISINKLYTKYKLEVNKHILLIEQTYGSKLSSHLEYEQGVRADIDLFITEVKDMKREIVGYVQNNDEKLDDCSDKLYDVSRGVEKANETLQELLDIAGNTDDFT